MAELTPTSIQLVDDKYVIMQNRHKAPRGRNFTQHTMLERHVGSTAFNAEIAGILALAPASGAPQTLLPFYRTARVNDGLKLAAKHFGWDASTPWSSHGLRFGSISDAWAEARAELESQAAPAVVPVGSLVNEILNRVQERSGHLDPEMAFWYALTVDERTERREACHAAIRARLARDADAEKRRLAREASALSRVAGQRRTRDA